MKKVQRLVAALFAFALFMFGLAIGFATG